MRILAAFLKRDWAIRSSYRLSFFISLGHVVFATAMFFFIGNLIDPHHSSALAPYGGAYFPFVLLGLVGSRYLVTSLSSFGGSLRAEQLQGTLEALLTTPTAHVTILLGGAVWELLWATLEVALSLVLGVVVFGVTFDQMNVPASLVVLCLSVVSLSSLGVLSASSILLFKESDPVSWVLEGLMKLLSGVYFPVMLLPGWLEPLAKLFPLTYALEGLRQAVLMGRSLDELGQVCVVLGVFAAVCWPLALLSFSWTLKRLKTTGALSFR